ncbi:hypothetical protein, partial [Mesorhizobium sp. M1A.F.Ca.IN.020.32.1.1]|uniref:hypothetical protein n=1 Tax=Mesorhizobium sp. M1A.F.Ca.IN.020.32.1.1 TaxID=2496763 RepID=UPI0019D49749
VDVPGGNLHGPASPFLSVNPCGRFVVAAADSFDKSDTCKIGGVEDTASDAARSRSPVAAFSADGCRN